MKNVICILMLGSNVALAAGGGGHGHVSDLIWPAVNLFALVFILIKLTKKGMSTYFTTQSEEIRSAVESAKIKAQEVQRMAEDQKKKTATLDAKIIEIKTDVDAELKSFDTSYQAETTEKISQLKTDASSRIEAEQKQLMGNLNELLLDAVISKTKEKVNADNSINSQATSKLLEGLK